MLFVDATSVSGILTDTEIRAAVNANWLISQPTFQESSLEASSYDVRIGSKAVLGGVGTVVNLLKQSSLELGPGAYAGIMSHEKFLLPDSICARLGSKRALAFDGIILLTGATVDPGYEGHLLFCIYNASQHKFHIRHNKKLCNIVFERLSKGPDKQAPADINLLKGEFPDLFLDRMANMEVLPWVQINDRVKQIETITKDIIDLKSRYEDVLQPIRDLTNTVQRLSDDVISVNALVSENSKQIQQLTTNLSTVTVSLQSVQERSRSVEENDRLRAESISTLKAEVSRFQTPIKVFSAILLLIIGAILSYIVPKVLQRVAAPSVPAAAPVNPSQQAPQSR